MAARIRNLKKKRLSLEINILFVAKWLLGFRFRVSGVRPMATGQQSACDEISRVEARSQQSKR
jgi:hypothetical protein